MSYSGIQRTAILCVAIIGSLGVVCETLAEAPRRPKQAKAADKLPGLCKAAQKSFVLPGKAQILKSRALLSKSVARLDERLNKAGRSAAGWREYLLWSDLKKQLGQKGDLDTKKLAAIHARFAQKHEGLGLVWFLDVRDALRQYISTVGAVGNKNLKAEYSKLLADLAIRLDAYAKKPTAENALWIGAAVGYLDETGQAKRLVSAVRREFCHPNLFLCVSEKVAGTGIGGPVEDVTDVEDCILGATVVGTGHTTGNILVDLIPNKRQASFQTVLRGVTESETVGYKGPVQIFSDGTTHFTARKRFFIDEEGLDAAAATSCATTDTTTKCIQTRRGSAIVERAAWNKVCKSKGQAEWISARHAEERINRRVDAQAEEMLARTNKDFKDKFREPLVQRRLFPSTLRFSTTSDLLNVTALRAEASQLAAPGAPPKLVAHPELGVQVHESIANNVAQSALAGVTLREDDFLKVLKKLVGTLPERLKPEEGKEPWGITFARQRPISVSFSDNTFNVTIRARRYYRGDTKHPGMNVSATYKIVKGADGFKAVRQGEVDISPPGFVPGKGKSLSARYTVIRNLLERRFNRIFEEELTPKQLKLPGKWEKAGAFSLAQWQTGDGWMVLAYR